jgi:hypothetical protein
MAATGGAVQRGQEAGGLRRRLLDRGPRHPGGDPVAVVIMAIFVPLAVRQFQNFSR